MEKKKMKQAELIYADSDRSADMYYAVKMRVPDPFLFLRVGGRGMIVMSDLEIGRARDEADVHLVVSLSELDKELKRKGVRKPGPADHAALLLKKHRVGRAVVPSTFPLAVADALRRRGIRVKVRPSPFFKRRVKKTRAEVRAIEKCQRANENSMAEALKVIRKARPRGKFLLRGGDVLTSEDVRRVINVTLLEQNCIGGNVIVAGGDQGCDPHNVGSGPLPANGSIIIDIAPRSMKTNYCSDMTRTVCRGRPSGKLLKIFETVLEGQALGCRLIKAGVRGIDVHKTVFDFFKERGYKTGKREGRMAGFFHGTGHGIGLNVHEPPRVSRNRDRLPAGAVVTCEPGLYYFGVGGVRIEDMLLVGRGGSRNLSRFPKTFVL